MFWNSRLSRFSQEVGGRAPRERRRKQSPKSNAHLPLHNTLGHLIFRSSKKSRLRGKASVEVSVCVWGGEQNEGIENSSMHYSFIWIVWGNEVKNVMSVRFLKMHIGIRIIQRLSFSHSTKNRRAITRARCNSNRLYQYTIFGMTRANCESWRT